MKRVHWYFAALAMRRTAAWAVATIVLWAAVDLADRSSVGWPLGAWPLRGPTALAQTLPFAALAGTVHALASLVLSRQWEAARGIGLATSGLLASLVVGPAVAAGVLLAAGETVGPAAAARWAKEGRGPLPGAAEAPAASRWSVRQGELVRGGDDPIVVRFRDAPRIDSAGRAPAARAWPSPATLGTRALGRVASAIEKTGHDASPYRAEAALRPVMALAALFVPWIALPIALALLRRSALWAAGGSAAVAIAAYAVLVVGLHAARGGASAAACAAAVVGTYLLAGVAARLVRTAAV